MENGLFQTPGDFDFLSDPIGVVSVRADQDNHEVTLLDFGPGFGFPLLAQIRLFERAVIDPVRIKQGFGLSVEVAAELLVLVELEAGKDIEIGNRLTSFIAG